MRVNHGLSLVGVLISILVLATVGVFVAVEPSAQLRHVAAHSSEDILRTRQTALVVGRPSDCIIGSFVVRGVGVRVPPRGLLFTPDGLPRTCDGGGVGNTTILLEHRGRQAAVIVSSLGRVRWELR